VSAATGGCHLYFARGVTFLSCTDNDCNRNIEMTPLRNVPTAKETDMTAAKGFVVPAGGQDRSTRDGSA
jgi:hypothetical protein